MSLGWLHYSQVPKFWSFQSSSLFSLNKCQEGGMLEAGQVRGEKLQEWGGNVV